MAGRMFRHPARREWADEAESVAAIRLVRAARLYDPARGPFEPFAGTVIRLGLRELIRRRSRQRATRPRHVSLGFEPAARPPRRGSTGIPAHLLAPLTPAQREVIRLRFVDGLSFVAIGKRLGKSKASVFRQIKRAVRTLREVMATDRVLSVI